MEPEHADTPFGTRSSAGKLFGASGGVMEAALRSAYFMITGHNLPVSEMPALRGRDSVKTTYLEIDGLKVGVAVCNGINNARKLVEEIKAGRDDLHFIEIMTCPSGCIGGGGQPYNADEEHLRARMQALYRIDQHSQLRNSHDNPDVRRLYEEFLGKPLGERSHQLLHTHYHAESVLV